MCARQASPPAVGSIWLSAGGEEPEGLGQSAPSPADSSARLDGGGAQHSLRAEGAVRAGVRCVSTGGTCTRIQQAQTPKGKAGPPSPAWEGSGRHGGALKSLLKRDALGSTVWWVGGEEAGMGAWAPVTCPSWVTYFLQPGVTASSTSSGPTSSVLCCEGTCPC